MKGLRAAKARTRLPGGAAAPPGLPPLSQAPPPPPRRSSKLAAAGADRVVHLYDEAGERRDKFRTKAADGNTSGAYLITGLAFSPDASKLAIAQSDCIVFVYRRVAPAIRCWLGPAFSWRWGCGASRTHSACCCRRMRACTERAPPRVCERSAAFHPHPHKYCRLGTGWDDKKSICNKFAQSSGAMCLAWAAGRHGDVCFGLADGKVKLGVLQTNKTYTLYTHADGSPATALAASLDGHSLVSGHADGSIYTFTFPEAQVCLQERLPVSHPTAGL